MGKIGWKMANGQLLFQALSIATLAKTMIIMVNFEVLLNHLVTYMYSLSALHHRQNFS